MKIKTQDLIYRALDWAVAEAVYRKLAAEGKHINKWALSDHRTGGHTEPYSTEWALGGPLVTEVGINTYRHNKVHAGDPDTWTAFRVAARPDEETGELLNVVISTEGPTELSARMRCYVRLFLGDEVDVPPEVLT